MDEYLFPILNENFVVAEIGSGGGRVASEVAGKVKNLYCFGMFSFNLYILFLVYYHIIIFIIIFITNLLLIYY